jgi:hypothetical protein
MKRQGTTPKYHGEERVREGSDSLLSRLLKTKPVETEILSQILGVELKSGEETSLAKLSDKYAEKASNVKEKPKQESQEFFEYAAEFKRTELKTGREDTIQIRQQIEVILVELKKLKDSSEELATVFRDVVIDEVPEKPGVYHLTFFEGFLKLVIKMRSKVEDGVIFAKLFKSRKKEKGYAAMAKKGGTSYTLHHDRTPATQTG